MRVLVVCPPGRSGLGACLAGGFDEAGHEASIAASTGLSSGNRPLILARRRGADGPLTALLAARVARQARRFAADAVLVVKGRFVRADDVLRLRSRLDVPVVVYYPDDPTFPAYAEPGWTDAIPAYDLTATWSENPATRLRKAGARRVAVVPFGYDPDLYPPAPADRRLQHDVVLVGQWQPERERALAALTDLKLAISGSGWAE